MAAHEHDHAANRAAPPRRHLIIWDGECGLCREWLDWVMANDRHGVLAELPYQEVPTPPMTPELREACRNAVHVLTADGRLLRAGRAVLFILDQLGWRRAVAIARVPPLPWLIEAGYRFVASHRPLASRLLRRLPARSVEGAAPPPTPGAAHHH